MFFQVNPSARIFYFQTNIAFFWTVKSWIIIYVFRLYKLFYTHNRSKDTGHFNAKSFRKCTHSERGGSHLEWTASLCIFSVPALWNSSPTAHHNDAILHSPKQQETSVDRPNTTHKLVIMWNVILRVCLNSGSLSFFFSRAKFTSTTQCKTCSILNFDWVNLVFAALSLIFRGHEAGLLHAYWVIISCGLCFCRCPW